MWLRIYEWGMDRAIAHPHGCNLSWAMKWNLATSGLTNSSNSAAKWGGHSITVKWKVEASHDRGRPRHEVAYAQTACQLQVRCHAGAMATPEPSG